MSKLIKVILMLLGLLLLILLSNFLSQKEVLPKAENEYAIAGATDVPKETFLVKKVIDGDTIIVEKDQEEFRVRMIGIDSPETVHPHKAVECFGSESSEMLKTLIEGKHVSLIEDMTQDERDKYGRLLRYVYFDDIDVNLEMVKSGYAFEYTYVIPYEKQDEYLLAEEFAKENMLGLWNPLECDYP